MPHELHAALALSSAVFLLWRSLILRQLFVEGLV